MINLREPERKYLKKLLDECIKLEMQYGTDALYDQIHDVFGSYSGGDLMGMYKELRRLERKGELDFIS